LTKSAFSKGLVCSTIHTVQNANNAQKSNRSWFLSPWAYYNKLSEKVCIFQGAQKNDTWWVCSKILEWIFTL